jgi:hypothetical protein
LSARNSLLTHRIGVRPPVESRVESKHRVPSPG